jgi:hypothetical protein
VRRSGRQTPSVDVYTDPARMASRDTFEIELEHRVFRAVIRDPRPVDPQRRRRTLRRRRHRR